MSPLSRPAGHRPAENRVEPVHGKTRLGHVEQVRLALDGAPQPLQRPVPGGALDAQEAGAGQGALEAHVDRTRSGQQGHGVHPALGAHGPVDFAPGGLEAQGEPDPPLDGRPQPADKPEVAGHQVVVIEPDGDVGGQVGVAGFVLGPPLAVGGVPAAVFELGARQPAEGAPGLAEPAAHGEGHGGLHVVPGIGLFPPAPGDLAAVVLVLGDEGADRIHVHRRRPPRLERIQVHGSKGPFRHGKQRTRDLTKNPPGAQVEKRPRRVSRWCGRGPARGPRPPGGCCAGSGSDPGFRLGSRPGCRHRERPPPCS